jgi:hypothetical protein
MISGAGLRDLRTRLLGAYNGLPAGQKPNMAVALEVVGALAVVADVIETFEVTTVMQAERRASFDHDSASRSRGTGGL